MIIYTLTEVDTRIGFECHLAIPFFSLDLAEKEMGRLVNQIIDDAERNGYGCNAGIHGNYAIVDAGGNKVYFDIISKNVTIYELAVALLHDKIVEIYKEDCFGDDLLLQLVSENSEDYVLSHCIFGNVEDFLNDTIIGEGLYQNATERLGGDPNKTEAIIDFFNENPKFVELGQKRNNCEYMGDNWLFAMCALCKNDETLIKECRIAIDESRMDKVFFDLKKAQNELFCKNHRKLSDILSDEAYISVCEQICGTPFVSQNLPFCRDMVEKCYVEFYKRAYELAKKKGINFLLNLGNIFEVREDTPVNYESDNSVYQLVIVGDAMETAAYIDYLEKIP